MKWMLLGLLAVGPTVLAQAPDEATMREKTRAFVRTLNFREGTAAIPDAKATIQLGSDFRYLEKADARRVLEELWGNPPDDEVIGLVVPREPALEDDASWAVVVTHSTDGHVSDEDAAEIDYEAMLADMKSEASAENEARAEAGYEKVELVGWAVPPRYDAATKKLHWAKELAFEGSKGNTLNYDIRVLGREGYLSLNAVARMADLERVRGGMATLIPRVEFEPGARYADFNESTDKVAAYGLAALVGGGLAAKTGLFAKLGVLLLGLKKLLLPLALGLAAAGRWLFGRFRKDRDGGTAA
ncbi:DUF2167 domain-containing protein [Lysobacter humi (ex Lee et al. 2017)]